MVLTTPKETLGWQDEFRAGAAGKVPAAPSSWANEFREQVVLRGLPVARRTAGDAWGKGMTNPENLPGVGTVALGFNTASIIGDMKAFSEGTATEEQKTHVLQSILESQREPTVGAMIGDMLTQMPAFMIEFLASGGVVAGAKGAAKKVAKDLVGEAVTKGMRDLAAAALKRQATRGVARFAGRVGGTTAKSALQAAIMPTGAVAHTMRAQMPELDLTAEEGGRLELLFKKDPEGFLESLPEGFGRAWIEMFSENSARLIPVEQLQAGVFRHLVGQKGKNRAFALLDKAGWQGTLPEMGEEVVGGILRATFMDDPWSEVLPSGKEALAQAVAFSVPGIGAAAGGKGLDVTIDKMVAKATAKADADVAAQAEAKNIQKTSRRPGKLPKRRATPESVTAAIGEYAAAQVEEGQDAPVLQEVQPESPGSLFAAGVADKLGVELVFVQGEDGKAQPKKSGGATVTAEGVPLVIVDAAAPAEQQVREVLNHELQHHLTSVVGLEQLFTKLVARAPKLVAAARARARSLTAGEDLTEAQLQDETISVMVQNITGVLDLGMRDQAALAEIARDRTLGEAILDWLASVTGKLGVTDRRLRKLQMLYQADQSDALGKTVPVELAAEAAQVIIEAYQSVQGKPVAAPSEPSAKRNQEKEATPGETAPIAEVEAPKGPGAAEARETPAEPSAPPTPKQAKRTLKKERRAKLRETRELVAKLEAEAREEIVAEDAAERLAPARIEREVAAQEGQTGAERRRSPRGVSAAQAAALESDTVGESEMRFATVGDVSSTGLPFLFSTAEFKAWFGDSIVTDMGTTLAEGGIPEQVYHGTTHAPFYEFSEGRGNIQNFIGKGFYFTTSPDDAAQNYAHAGGADLAGRTEERASRIEDEIEDEERWEAENFLDEADVAIANNDPMTVISYGTQKGQQWDRFSYAERLARRAMRAEAQRLAEREMVGTGPAIMPVYVRMERPYRIIRGVHEEFSEEDQNRIADALSHVMETTDLDVHTGNDSAIQDLIQSLLDGDLGRSQMMHKELFGVLAGVAMDPETGDDASGQIYQEVIREAGYDGVELDASAQFPHMAIEEGTKHYIVFDNKAVKSVHNKGTYARDTGNMMFASLPKAQTPQEQERRERSYRSFFKKESKLPEWFTAKFGYEVLRTNFIDLLRPLEKALELSVASGEGDPLVALRLSESAGRQKVEKILKEFQAVADLFKDAEELEAFGVYLVARHARARNKHIQENVNQENYAGSGMTNLQADDLIKSHQDDPRFAQGYEMMRELVDATLDARVAYGLQSQATADAWRDKYGPTYMPLSGFLDEFPDAEEDQYHISMPYPKLFVRDTQKAAKGRQEGDLPANPLQEAAKLAVRTAFVGERNLAMQDIYRHAEANPDLAETITDTELRKRQAAKDPLVVNLNTSDLARAIVEGETIYFRYNDPAATKILAEFGESDLNDFMRAIGKVTRWVAKSHTQWAPSFFGPNAIRDTLTGRAYWSATYGAASANDLARNTKGAAAAAVALTYDRTIADEFQEAVRVYTEEGGQLSVAGLDTRDEIRKLMEVEIKVSDPGYIEKFLVPTFGWIGKFSRITEDITRLAAVKTALDMGMSDKDAAMAGRKVSVDFGRRGRLSSSFGTFYAFFNASMQGIAQMTQVVSKSNGRKHLGRFMAFGVLWHIAMTMLSGDDEDGRLLWDTIPDYKKGRSIVFLFGDDEITLPVPPGLSFFWGASQSLGRLITGADSGGKMTGDILSDLVKQVNPLGGETMLGSVLPTPMEAFVEVEANQNWRGAPINPESFFSSLPKSGSYFPNVSESAKYIAKMLNTLSGGDEAQPGFADVHPGSLEHMFAGLFGGAGRDAVGAFDFAMNSLQGKQTDRTKIPVSRRLWSHEPRRNVTRLFELRKKARHISERERAYRDAGHPDQARELMRDNAELMRNKKKLDNAAKEYRALNAAGDTVGSLEAVVKAIKPLGSVE